MERAERGWLVGLVLAGCVALAWGAVRWLPELDKAWNPEAAAPGPVTLLGTGAALSLLCAVALYASLAGRWGMGRSFLAYAILFNVLIVLAKFTLGPLGLYDANRTRSWSVLGGGPPDFEFEAIVVFLLYALVFAAVALTYRIRAGRVIKGRKEDLPEPWSRRGRAVVPTALLVCFFTAVAVLLVQVSLSQYASFALSGAVGVALALALACATLLATAAFDSLARQAIALRRAGMVTSFLFVGLAFIAIHHALWAVYVALVVSLWPLRTVTTK